MTPINFYYLIRGDGRIFTLEDQVDIPTLRRWYLWANEECR
jgi:hypothetical protein